MNFNRIDDNGAKQDTQVGKTNKQTNQKPSVSGAVLFIIIDTKLELSLKQYNLLEVLPKASCIMWWILTDFNDDLFLNSSGGTTLMLAHKSIT